MNKDLRQEIIDQESRRESERLASTLDVIAAYAPSFAFLVSLGFGVIYIIALNGFPNQEPPVQLLWLAGTAALAGLLYLFAPRIIHSGKLVAAILLMLLPYTLFIMTLAVFWKTPELVLYILVWVYPFLIFVLATNRTQRLIPIVVGVVGSIAIFVLTRVPLFGQLAPGKLVTSIATAYLVFIIVSWLGLIIIVRIIQFKTLTARLTSSFLLLVMIPAVITTLVAAFQSYTRDTNNVYQILDSNTLVKEQQINQVISGMHQDVGFMLRDPVTLQRFGFLFESEPNSAISKINKSIVLGYLNNIIEQTGNKYEEALLLDLAGNVVLSTQKENVGKNFENQPFFRQGLLKPFSTTVTDVPEFGQKAFLVTEAIKDRTGKTVGVISLRSKYDVFESIVEQPSGTGIEDETYLLGENLVPLTNTLTQVTEINTKAALNAINGRQAGYDTYQNYTDTTVLGAYRWLPGLRAAVISEVSQQRALVDTYILISTIFAVGLAAIALAIFAVFLTARTISTPITSLAHTAGQISSGDFSTRSNLVRSDEIGQLSDSFNVMADKLQGFIGGLEQKIAERTRDLQRQAVRLRVASEISRDSATATELHELLNRSAQLIRERFGFYHSAFFLLDDNREYALLSAASSDAGRLMLETGYKMRVGEGIVGFVAQTGEPRIALDTDADSIYFRNPLLPATRSELSLPLKVFNRVIGVLDVQSDLHNAFTEDDIATLQIMADQLAVAIERTRVYQDSQDSLRELKRGYQGYTEESWNNLTRMRNFIAGYSYEGVNVKPLSKMPGEAVEVYKSGTSRLITDNTGRVRLSTLTTPIKVRGETIGVIKLNVRGEGLPEETVALVEEITNRIGVSLETSRLVYESRQQADRERAVSEAAAKISGSTSFEEILRAATEELGKILGESEVVVQLNAPGK